MFNPTGFVKRKLDPLWVSFDPSNVSDDTLENIDPDSDRAEGILSIKLTPGGKTYRFNATYQDYLDFEATGFDTTWLVELGVVGPGGWGWPFGRTTRTGFAGWGWADGRDHSTAYGRE